MEERVEKGIARYNKVGQEKTQIEKVENVAEGVTRKARWKKVEQGGKGKHGGRR